MQNTPTIEMTAGDTAPAYTFLLQRVDGTLPDLTQDDTEVLFVISNPETGEHTNDPAVGITNVCTIVDANQAIIKYTWNPGGTDVPAAGMYPVKLRIMYGGVERESADLTINAEADV